MQTKHLKRTMTLLASAGITCAILVAWIRSYRDKSPLYSELGVVELPVLKSRACFFFLQAGALHAFVAARSSCWGIDPHSLAVYPTSQNMGLLYPCHSTYEIADLLGGGIAFVNGVAIPVSVPFVLAFSAVTIQFMFWRRAHLRRSAQQCCVRCGYDLRATPERCPECGQKARPKPANTITKTT
jgi:hypothetical protein